MSSRISFNFSSSPSFRALTSLQQNISIIILNHSNYYNLREPTHDGNMQHSTHTLTLESVHIKIGHSRRCTFKKLLLQVNKEVRLRGLPKYNARNSRFCMPSYAVNFPILNCMIVSVRAIWSSSSSTSHHTAFHWYIYLVWHMTFQSSHSWLISNVISSFILIVSCRINLSIHLTLSIIRAQSSISMVDAVFWKWVILYNRQWKIAGAQLVFPRMKQQVTWEILINQASHCQCRRMDIS